MCGIVGLVQLNGARIGAADLLAMADAIRHRGPDDVGYILGNAGSGAHALYGGADTPAEVFGHPLPYAPAGRLTPAVPGAGGRGHAAGYTLGLANRRLAIVDLTPAGHQPICNEDRSVWIVYNGELYNADELRSELAGLGHRFVSHSDTEVIVHAYEAWGAAAPARFNGMWAFAIWDIPQRRLFLSRDRAGIKPLYFWRDAQAGRFAFASEIKALLALDIPRRANPALVYDFLAANLSDHTDETFFAGIRALPPAHSLTLDLATATLTQARYWQLDPARQIRLPSDAAYADAFRELFEDAVRRHLISDVPVGTCLSGGLDSSAVVCVINRLIRPQAGERGLRVVGMEAQQKTFSARYTDARHDEGRFIASVIRAADVDGRMTYPSPTDLRDNWQTLFYHQEEPFVSTSIFAQWSVFKLAREAGITVTLDGQGGDELLGGYLGFFPYYFADLAAGFRWPTLGHEFRRHIALHRASGQQEARNILTNLLPAGIKARLKNRASASLSWLTPDFTAAAQVGAESRWLEERIGGSRLAQGLYRSFVFDPLPSLLRFDDRNAMAHSIESRVPFLDYRLVEFCFALPPAQKIQDGVTKSILRRAMVGILPEDVRLRQDKLGFSTPQDSWLRETLAAPGPRGPHDRAQSRTSWLREVFTSPDFRSRPYFQGDVLMKLLDAHQQGANASTILWRCLAVELWHRAMGV
jgi:asparagine synthase (glutamine-hydrolysing)